MAYRLRYFFSTEIGAGILSQMQYVPRAILLFIFVVLSYLYVREHKKNTINRIRLLLKQRWVSLLMLYFSYLLLSTVFARNITNPLQFVTDQVVFQNDHRLDAEIIQNILLFIPYTFLILQSFKLEEPFKLSLIVSLCTTVIIEIVQLVFWLGAFQLSDIIYNTVGGIVGYLIWRIFIFIFSVKSKLKYRKSKNDKGDRRGIYDD